MNTLHTGLNGRGQAPIPVKVVTGQRIAKAHRTYSPRHRAEDAVRWLKGELQIKQTLKLAARTTPSDQRGFCHV